jgi:hypothetical protein
LLERKKIFLKSKWKIILNIYYTSNSRK